MFLFSFFNSSIKWRLLPIQNGKMWAKIIFTYFAYTYIINRLAWGFAHCVKAYHAWWNIYEGRAPTCTSKCELCTFIWSSLFVLKQWNSQNLHSCLGMQLETCILCIACNNVTHVFIGLVHNAHRYGTLESVFTSQPKPTFDCTGDRNHAFLACQPCATTENHALGSD